MGSVIRELHYDKNKKILGPKCHRCETVMRKTGTGGYGDFYKCDKCGATFKEEAIP